MAEPRFGTLDFVAQQNPGGEAIVEGKGRRTWREWDERACRLASFLRDRLGIGGGDRVAWMLDNCAEYFDLAFALQKLGAVAVAIGYRLTGSEAAYIVDNSDAKVLVCDARFVPRLQTARNEMPRIRDDAMIVVGHTPAAAGSPPGATPFEQAIATGSPEPLVSEPERGGGILIYTSGTTGRPKGAYREGSVPELWEKLREFFIGIIAGFGYTTPDKHLLTCPLYHSAPPVFAGITHLLGGPVVIMRHFDPEEALRLIQDEQITSSFMVPTMLNRITALPPRVLARYDLSSMRRLITGGAPCPIELKRKVIDLFPNPCLYEFYGATETAINTIIGPHDHLRKPGSCGTKCPGTEIRILDEAGNEVPAGEVGILYVRNPVLISGYHKNRAATEQCLRDGFFTVGDMARVDEDGFYYVVDRATDMIISGGVNIYPAEIESCLRSHPAVYDCAVIGVPNEEWGEEVKAIVQLRADQSVTAEELREFLSSRLADYKRPRTIEFTEALPYNPAGKLLKKELRRRYWESAGRSI